MQQAGGGLEFLMVEQPADERVARILFALVGLCGIGPRQQHAALDVNQRGRHHQELAREIQIELLHQPEVVEVLLGDERDRNVVHVHLILPNQMNEQIEGAFERLQLDPDVFELRFEALVSRRRTARVHGRFTHSSSRLRHHRHSTSSHPQYFNFTAVRTRSIVSCATARARRDPSTMTSRM